MAIADRGSALPDIGLAFDEEGNARLIVDDRLAVNVYRHDGEGRLVLSAPVAAELPEDIGYARVLDLLDLALGSVFAGSPAVGRDPVSGMLVAFASVSYAEVSEAEWPEIFGGFVSFALGMEEKLKNV